MCFLSVCEYYCHENYVLGVRTEAAVAENEYVLRWGSAILASFEIKAIVRGIERTFALQSVQCFKTTLALAIRERIPLSRLYIVTRFP